MVLIPETASAGRKRIRSCRGAAALGSHTQWLTQKHRLCTTVTSTRSGIDSDAVSSSPCHRAQRQSLLGITTFDPESTRNVPPWAIFFQLFRESGGRLDRARPILRVWIAFGPPGATATSPEPIRQARKGVPAESEAGRRMPGQALRLLQHDRARSTTPSNRDGRRGGRAGSAYRPSRPTLLCLSECLSLLDRARADRAVSASRLAGGSPARGRNEMMATGADGSRRLCARYTGRTG